MTPSPSPGEELRATVEARRELGPEFEDSLVESFLEKVDLEIDRRVDRRVEARARSLAPQVRPSVAAGQRLALSIVSLGLGVPATIGLAASEIQALLPVLLILWVGIVGVNFIFSKGGRQQ
ncbi:hypothetical protein [Planomonospora venezuelensis]|uniref:Integral membrane protein n=1 Tax=Planomonospora venezuelensis TaxID=1999 RepID=A0A841D4D9_PLAVE|nr:hypothetical protein [Planomonospora venezuelensis]MBB5964339.1 hypothetical protein [Planomonospora venezuelensis]GIM98508.1 hypothetical protein Pve01_01670 [Planomonospora venezuelensis]